MEPALAVPADVAQIVVAKKVLALENQIKGGTSWFFWIAVASIVNSTVYFFGGSFTFVVGLGATQFMDGAMQAAAHRADGGLSMAIGVAGIGLDLFFAGIFIVLGVFARKRYRWAVVIGMILYALDGIIFVVFGDWIAALFQLFALVGLLRGLTAINKSSLLEKSQSAGDLAAVQRLVADPKTDPAVARKYRIRLYFFLGVTFLLLFILVMGVLLYK
jgi:hypothetical protein